MAIITETTQAFEPRLRRDNDLIPAVSLRDILNVLFQHKKGMMIVFGASVVIAILYVLIAPPVYIAESKVLVKMGREQLAALELNDSATPNVVIQQREQNINNEIEILQDPSLSAEVFPILKQRLKKPGGGSSSPAAAGDAALPLSSDDEELMDEFRKAFKADYVRLTDVVQLEFEWDDPEFAAFALNTYVRAYRGKHMRVHANDNSRDFYVKQMNRADEEMSSVNSQLNEYLEKGDISDVKLEKELALRFLGDSEKERNDTQIEIENIKLRLASLDAAFARSGQWIDTPAGIDAPAIDSRDDAYVALLQQRSHLLERYMPGAREVLEVERQIAQLRKQKYESMRNALEVKTETLKERLTMLNAKVEAKKQDLRALTARESAVSVLDERRQVTQENLSKYRRKVEQLAVGEGLNEEDFISVKVISAAVPPEEPSRPRKTLILVLSVAFGAVAALAFAITSQFFNHTFNAPRDVARLLNLTTLATIPRFNDEGYKEYLS